MSSDDPFVTFDGAYVLGALSDTDRVAYEAHLAECDDCARSVSALSDLPRLLATVPESALLDEPPPPTLLTAVQRRAHRDRHRRRWIAGGIAAAVAACLVTVTVLLTGTGSDSGSSRHPLAMTAVAQQVPIEATADVREVAWGTQIQLVCRYYADGGSTTRPYGLVVVDHAGNRHELGTWNLLPGKVTTYRSGTSLSRADIAQVDITTTSGTPVLKLDL